ncbi:BON domain-containing protein [Vibrio sp. IB15]|uniref:BON domain-containing protein n=1 Tax=Vibrio chagasii TaxID=170679 RepID=A0A7V7NTI4_9VIBR|nr:MULTISPECIES: BON domain-containing protein [Vibrio]KAB0479410.1 BON domain-containing protein [Vibrio chagasii]MBJ2146926.1 BON domain-containing protein [Vibrio sp. IB15]MCG9562766.1 BON domain-containing protein [Vibrio chagasii]MCG9674982.1 BON domain-containing protein [Vibrio chagasii]NOI95294.1 BON domain-containing protein [Vibrio sp. T3Y01]
MKSFTSKTLLKLISVSLLTLSLSGCAGIFIAGAATTANIVTDTRTTKEIWNDNNIEFEVAAITNKQPYRGSVRVTASSYRGSVVLMGQATTDAERRSFESQAKDVPGVDTIHNQIRVKEPLSVSAISKDSWITTKVKSALLANSELNGIKVKVITEDSEVFLLGLVSREHADIATEVARNISGVKQVIRAFEYGEEETAVN